MKGSDERPHRGDRLPATLDLDLLPTREVVRRIQAEDATVPAACAAAAEALAAAIDAICERLQGGGRLFYAGAGTSGRIAMLDAAELPPTYGTPPELVQVILAGGTAALVHAVEGVEDDADAARREVRERVRAGDALLGIAASGMTPFTVAAVGEARGLGALAVAMTCRADTPLVAEADLVIVAATGAEVVMGSTRMKAGTAQKLLLNALSTALMVRLGRVHSNLMIEMPATNAKLRRRASAMVEEAAGVAHEEAVAALAAAGGDVKVAVLVASQRCSVVEARERLDAAAGNLRRALGAQRGPQ